MPFRIQVLLVLVICAAIVTLFRPYWGLLLLVLITIARPQDDRPNVGQLHVQMIITWAVIIGTLARPAVLVPRLGLAARRIALFASFFFLMLVSALINGWTFFSQRQLDDTWTVFIVCSLILVWVSTEERLKAFLWTLIISGLHYVRSAINSPRSMIHEEIGGAEFDRLNFRNAVNFGNPNFLAILMVILSFIVLAMLVYHKRFWLKAALCGMLGCFLFVFLKCQSRGATLGFAVSLIGFWMLQKRKLLTATLMLLAIGLGLIFFAPATYFERLKTIATYQEDSSAMGRLNAWSYGRIMIAENPLFGVGPANSEPLARKLYGATSQHNAYLQVAAEIGLPGLLLYITMLLSGFRSVWTTRRLAAPYANDIPYLYTISAAFASILIAFTVQGMFTGFGYREFVYMVLMLCYCMRSLAEKPAIPAIPEMETEAVTSGANIVARDSATTPHWS